MAKANADELRRAQTKEAALLRARFNLGVAWDRIDFNLDVIEPAKRQIAKDILEGKVPQYQLEEANDGKSS